jgi:uncharacterized membrane protein
MKTIFISLISVMLTMLVLDAIWLSVMIKRFYPLHIGHLLADSPKIIPGAFFYIIYALGLYLFVVQPSLQNDYGYLRVLLMGCTLGFLAYSTYDLTNHATLKNWPLIVTVVDMAWGTFLTGVVSLSSVYITRYFS